MLCTPEMAASSANRPSPDAANAASSRPARRSWWSQRERSTSSSVSATPASSTRAGRRASPSRMTARSPRTSVSSGKTATRASAIESAWRPRSASGSRGSRTVRCATVNIPATQSRTTGSRTSRSPASGTWNSPRACARAFFARVSRAAAALSWMPRCIAVSAMVSPQTTRRASTICAPGASSSSQATNSRASRSSSSSGSSPVSTAAIASSDASSGARRAKVPRRRWSSIHARLATRTHQAARSSMSSSGHGPRHRFRGVLLGVVQAARPCRQDAHDARPGGPELAWLVGRTAPCSPMPVTNGRCRAGPASPAGIT